MLDSLDLGETNSLAVDVFRSLNERSDVVVYGDYDVDGISATAWLLEMALHRKASAVFHPAPVQSGYGLHSDVATTIAKRSVTCDRR